jgi:hypothetical protein
MDELRDIKPIIDYAPAWPWWVWAIAAAALLTACALVWLVRRKRRPVVAAAVDPSHAALVALDALSGMEPSDRISGQRLQTQLSMILRSWLESRWSLRATDMTTEELAANLVLARSLGAENREALLDVLVVADRVRFADEDLQPAQHAAAVKRARSLVRGMQAA